MLLVLFLFFMIHFLGVAWCNTGIQQPPTMLGFAGRAGKLSCSHPSITTETIIWYQQLPGGAPRHIISAYSEEVNSEDPKGTLHVAADRKASTFSLAELRLQDSAVYFCALSGTKTGYDKVIFGSGTRLVVMPILEDSIPSVYQLKGNKEESDLAACLFTDYSPDSIKVKINKGDLDAETINGSSVVVVRDGDNKESASFGVVRWGKKDEQFQCSAIYKGNHYEAEEEEDTCPENKWSSTPVFKTDERLNLLSLTVLGLRVIFFKSVALNLILTYYAWSR